MRCRDTGPATPLPPKHHCFVASGLFTLALFCVAKAWQGVSSFLCLERSLGWVCCLRSKGTCISWGICCKWGSRLGPVCSSILDMGRPVTLGPCPSSSPPQSWAAAWTLQLPQPGCSTRPDDLPSSPLLLRPPLLSVKPSQSCLCRPPPFLLRRVCLGQSSLLSVFAVFATSAWVCQAFCKPSLHAAGLSSVPSRGCFVSPSPLY